jgi:putative Mg2+ transporter-C (MgtC) family protein
MNDPLPYTDIAARLASAFVASMIIGMERESHGRAAGLRTTTLAGVAAAVAMLLSEYLYARTAVIEGAWHPDPARLAAGILTGMGFLGGGVIIKEGNVIRGVTTAAVLWLVAILGLAFGSGELTLGWIGWGLAMLTLMWLHKVEVFVKNDAYGAVIVRARMERADENEVVRRIETHGARVQRVALDFDFTNHEKTVRYEVKYKRLTPLATSRAVIDDLKTIDGVLELKWE